MDSVICGYLNGHKIVVNKLTGEASLLDDELGNAVLTYINVLDPIDHSADDVCAKLANAWQVDGVITSTRYFVKMKGTTAEYYEAGNMSTPFLTTPFGIEYLES